MRRISFKTALLAITLSICLSIACWGGNAKLSADLRAASTDDQNVLGQGGAVESKLKSIQPPTRRKAPRRPRQGHPARGIASAASTNYIQLSGTTGITYYER